ncbi:methyltransferase domain-containing protein [Mesorhizobium sangaii]|uniref:Ubiquinone/menaquinone biosynthesis C-methylase UbiE n=1 Tax=Mesorhizobium sangaii TaxID=505389 RepID=A0A841PFN6_9HYPH|nr:methyltransferase domain-containing protein [Mesorhizobium sangaii]MBB6413966.1 ubiquinone/menaquinone biosynthesis C-methylase UbiE [Mesorhizobium sangaii]
MAMAVRDSDSYIIKGGKEGRARLAVISRVLAPSTQSVLDRFEPLSDSTVIDAGCAGGDVSFELAQRVGANGRVVGIDFDESKLVLAREEAAARGIGNIEFHNANILHPWPADGATLVHVRFVLTHLADPERLLERAWEALLPGGAIVTEDIDYGSQFCDPPCPAFDRYVELYVEAARRRGADPFIGRRLVRLLEGVGFADVDSALTQPYGRQGDVKQVPMLTFSAIANALTSSGIATSDEVGRVTAELDAFAARPDTTMSCPRIFQAWGRKPVGAQFRPSKSAAIS